MASQLLWFKRDLRLEDHAPLRAAAERGPVICLYIYEPSLLSAEDFGPAHQVFINESLQELAAGLTALGGALTLRVGEAVEVLERLRLEHSFEHIWAHEETGTYASYVRDRRVRAWARSRGVAFTELPAGGVVRRLTTRDGWAKLWQARMKRPLTSAPKRLCSPEVERGAVQPLKALGLPPSTKTLVPVGGESHAHAVLDDFLCRRGQNYRREMSSPVTAFEGSSRLSAYLAWGNISVRQIYQAALARKAELKENPHPEDKGWTASLTSFLSRLRWHDHFIQKLEVEPGLEFYNTNRGFDGLRENEFNADYFEAWKAGQTGYPMVDACTRCLQRTGWLNFRMRAMIVSFASYHLWLHWRETGLYLAKQWIDAEPGIHWPQMQMQSGVTGINTIRIYSPRKQVEDQDPTGIFLKAWLPELTDMPDAYLAEPHTAPPMVQEMAGCRVGKDYPAPIVDPKAAYARARTRMREAKFSPEVQALKDEVYERHGSRATPSRRRGKW